MPSAVENSVKANVKAANVTPLRALIGEGDLRDIQFQLSHHLQSTLDLHGAVEQFYKNLQDVVAVDGLNYEKNDSNARVLLGEQAKHSLEYRINSDNDDLGTIVFYRRKRFLEGEMAVIEMLIGVLFYPLKNALMYREAVENSMRDNLTGVGNRTAMETNFEREVKLAHRHHQDLSVFIIDVDNFKHVNDTFGHSKGDEVLKHIAHIVKDSLRETDQLFRYGGEEFLVILNNTCSAAAGMIAERIRCKVKAAVSPINQALTISIGVTSIVGQEETAEQLFSRADTALYQAKNSGRDKVVMDVPQQQRCCY